jgi:radical SAM superfamily enzyme with C-terminal helix-hairpin-helix motif
MNCLSSVGSSTELHYITGGRDRHKKSEAKNMADFDAIPMATGSFWPGKYH